MDNFALHHPTAMALLSIPIMVLVLFGLPFLSLSLTLISF